MSFVEVEFRVLGDCAASAYNCSSTLESQKNAANGEVENLQGAWAGQDATDFFNKWEETKGEDSSYGKLKYAVESFGRYCDYCKAQYMNAQNNAYNRARLIL